MPWKSAMPLMAMLLDSVAPEVKTNSLESHLMREAICSLEFSTALSAYHPYSLRKGKLTVSWNEGSRSFES